MNIIELDKKSVEEFHLWLNGYKPQIKLWSIEYYNLYAAWTTGFFKAHEMHEKKRYLERYVV